MIFIFFYLQTSVVLKCPFPRVGRSTFYLECFNERKPPSDLSPQGGKERDLERSALPHCHSVLLHTIFIYSLNAATICNHLTIKLYTSIALLYTILYRLNWNVFIVLSRPWRSLVRLKIIKVLSKTFAWVCLHVLGSLRNFYFKVLFWMGLLWVIKVNLNVLNTRFIHTLWTPTLTYRCI